MTKRLLARWKPFAGDEHDSPEKAIRGARQGDAFYRTVANEAVCGRLVRDMLWNEGALTFVLEPTACLNLAAAKEKVLCSLDDRPLATESIRDADVILDLDGLVSPWPMPALFNLFVGKELRSVFFSRDHVWVYTAKDIIACALMESAAEGTPWLYWYETD